RHGDRHLGAGADPGVELLAGLVVELLGVVEPARHALGVEDDGSGHHRTGEGAAPGLVAAGDRPDAALERAPLAAEGRTDVLLLPERKTGDANGGGSTHGRDGAQDSRPRQARRQSNARNFTSAAAAILTR